MAQSELDPVTLAANSPKTESLDREDEESTIDLLDLLKVLIRGKKTIFVIALIAFALGTAIAYLLPVKYTSTASFIPPSANSNSLSSAVVGQLSALGGGDLLGGGKTVIELYAGILKSRSVVGTIVKRFDLMSLYKAKRESDAEKDLLSNTEILADGKSSIISVSVTDKSPGRAHDLASAYMDALRETDGRLALSQSSQRRLFFGQQLAKEKDSLADAEVELKKTEEQSGLIAPSGQTESQIKTIAETQGQMALRQVQLAAMREGRTEQDPDVVRLRSEIADLQGQLNRLQSGETGTAAAIPTSKMPQLQLDYVRKQREVLYRQALFDGLARQYEAARLDEAHDAPVLQMLDPASYPDVKSGPRRMYFMAGGLFSGFFAGCIWVLIRDHLEALRSSLTSGDTA